jgi:hypothetical protein
MSDVHHVWAGGGLDFADDLKRPLRHHSTIRRYLGGVPERRVVRVIDRGGRYTGWEPPDAPDES